MADANIAYRKLLLHFNGSSGSTTFTDSSNDSRTVTALGAAQLGTSVVKFGTASLDLTSNGAAKITDMTGIGSIGDFMIEMQVYPTASETESGVQTFFYMYDAVQDREFVLLRYSASGYDELQAFVIHSSSVVASGFGTTAVGTGAWKHIEWVRTGSTNTLRINGIEETTFTYGTAIVPTQIVIGAAAQESTTTYHCYGHIDEVRLTVGLNEHTADFTPPTAEYEDGSLSVYIEADSPLGELQSLTINGVGGFIAQGDIFGDFEATAFHDFTAFIDYAQPMRYVMDLETPDGLVRVPISSWQATLNVGRSGYGQAVIPNAGDYVDDLTAATEFVVSRQMTLFSGTVVVQEMTRTPADYVTLAQGPNNYTATVYGYPAEWPLVEDPDVRYDRTLTGIRSMTVDSGGTRVRCAIDYLLKPGQRAYAGSTPIIVSYINYYVPGVDEYMDIGERLT